MKDAADYLGQIKALIALNRQVVHWAIVREEAQSDVGLLRYQLSLSDGGLLQMFERYCERYGKQRKEPQEKRVA